MIESLIFILGCILVYVLVSSLPDPNDDDDDKTNENSSKSRKIEWEA
jgi:hypothetical protein